MFHALGNVGPKGEPGKEGPRGRGGAEAWKIACRVGWSPVWCVVMRGCPFSAVMAGMFLGSALSVDGAGVETIAPEKPQFSVSPSRQFVIYAKESGIRMAFSSSAEAVKRRLLTLLALGDEWRYEIVIQVDESEPVTPLARYSAGRVIPLEDGFRFQLDVKLASGFTRREFNRELIRLLLLEEMLSAHAGQEAALKTTRLLPPWLHDGLSELVRYRDEGTPIELFSGLLGSRKILEIQEILGGEPSKMDSVSRTAFEGSSAAFVRSLLEQDSGAQRLARTIRELPRYEGDVRPLLLEFYPALSRSSSSMEKWWALEVASMAQPKALDFLSIGETRRMLGEALTVRLDSNGDGPRTAPLSDFRTIEKSGDLRRLLVPNKILLMRLSYRCFPLYRSIIDDYREVLERMMQYKSLGISGRLEKVDERRARLDALLENMSDYLNWYEAARVSAKSGAFEDYKMVVDELRREEPVREDRISRYLDEVEARLGERQ